MLTLYHFPLDPASRFIRLLLAEYGVAVELQQELPWESRKEFLLLNPAGAVPVLVEGTAAICGALAIAEYIDETLGIHRAAGRLMPVKPAERAEVRRLVEWFMLKFENDVGRIFMNERVLKRYIPGNSAPDVALLRQGGNNLRYHMLYIAWLLQSQNTLAGSVSGESLTYADFAAAACLSTLDYFGDVHWDVDEHVRQWYARMKSRPSFRAILADRMPTVAPTAAYADLDF